MQIHWLAAAAVSIAAPALAEINPPPPHAINSPCCHSPPAENPPPSFPSKHHKIVGVGPVISRSDLHEAVEYIRRSCSGARVRLEVHAPRFDGTYGASEQAQADDVARRLIHRRVPAGSIAIEGFPEPAGSEVWFVIVVERLKKL